MPDLSPRLIDYQVMDCACSNNAGVIAVWRAIQKIKPPESS